MNEQTHPVVEKSKPAPQRKRWTRDEMDLLEKLVEQNVPYKDMEETFGRKRQAICAKAHDLGLKLTGSAKRVGNRKGREYLDDIQDMILLGYSARKIAVSLKGKIGITTVWYLIQEYAEEKYRIMYRYLHAKRVNQPKFSEVLSAFGCPQNYHGLKGLTRSQKVDLMLKRVNHSENTEKG